MRRRGPQLVETLTVRVNEDLAARLDARVQQIQRRVGPDFKVERSDALREILERSLRRR